MLQFGFIFVQHIEPTFTIIILSVIVRAMRLFQVTKNKGFRELLWLVNFADTRNR